MIKTYSFQLEVSNCLAQKLFKNVPIVESKRWRVWRPFHPIAKRLKEAKQIDEFKKSMEKRKELEAEMRRIMSDKKVTDDTIEVNELTESVEPDTAQVKDTNLMGKTSFDVIPDINPLAGECNNIPVAKLSPFSAAHLLGSIGTTAVDTRLLPIQLKLNINIDLSRHSFRGIFKFPHAVGTRTKLLVFCPDELAANMIKAGADFAGGDSMIDKISKGWLAFDQCITTVDFVPKIIKLARILGPKRLMPNTRSGTIVVDLIDGIQEMKSGSSVEYRAMDTGDVVVPVGLMSSPTEELLENIKSFVKEVAKNKPRDEKKAKSRSKKNVAVKKWWDWDPKKRPFPDDCGKRNVPAIKALVRTIRYVPQSTNRGPGKSEKSKEEKGNIIRSAELVVEEFATISLLVSSMSGSGSGFYSPAVTISKPQESGFTGSLVKTVDG